MALSRQPKKETITVSSADIDWIKGALTNLSNKVDAVDKTVGKLDTTIIGDQTYGQVGLIKDVSDLKEYVEKDKNWKAKVVGGGIVAGVFWTIILKFWDKIF